MIRERPPQFGDVALLEAEGPPVSDLTEWHLVRRAGSWGSRSMVRLRYYVDRAQAPASIQSTREFASLCPSSSAFMIKRL